MAGSSPGPGRHRVEVAHRPAVAGCAGTVRPLADLLWPAAALAARWDLAKDLGAVGRWRRAGLTRRSHRPHSTCRTVGGVHRTRATSSRCASAAETLIRSERGGYRPAGESTTAPGPHPAGSRAPPPSRPSSRPWGGAGPACGHAATRCSASAGSASCRRVEPGRGVALSGGPFPRPAPPNRTCASRRIRLSSSPSVRLRDRPVRPLAPW
jgi:hypothetical protein